MSDIIKIYTDGSALGNPGRGGYGAILQFRGNTKQISQGYGTTTNNRMELLAVISALDTLVTNEYPIHIYSDSKYVIDPIIKGWLHTWVDKGFKGKKNSDLWKRYIKIQGRFNIQYHWVKGHSGDEFNEKCDRLAVDAAKNGPYMIDFGYVSKNGK